MNVGHVYNLHFRVLMLLILSVMVERCESFKVVSKHLIKTLVNGGQPTLFSDRNLDLDIKGSYV